MRGSSPRGSGVSWEYNIAWPSTRLALPTSQKASEDGQRRRPPVRGAGYDSAPVPLDSEQSREFSNKFSCYDVFKINFLLEV